MKKILSFVLSMLMILSLGAMLFSCDVQNIEISTDAATGDTTAVTGDVTEATTDATTEAATEGETVAPHTCEFNTEAWANDEKSHWHACKTEDCTAKQDEAEHAFTSPVIEQSDGKITRTYTCEVCAYEKVEQTTIDSIIKNEATWDQAFDNLSFVNYSVTINITDDGETQVNHVEVGNTAAHYEIPGFIEFYTAKGDDGTYATYINYQGYGATRSGFAKLSDNTTDKYYTIAATEALLQISFAENFEKFTYDKEKGAYVCAEEIGAIMFDGEGQPLPETMTCYNSVVKVADGKITHVEADYYLGEELEEGMSYHFCYYNIGMTEVVVPQSVIDSAVEKTEAELGLGTSSGPEDVEGENKVEVEQDKPEQDVSGQPEKAPENNNPEQGVDGQPGQDAGVPEEAATAQALPADQK